MNNTLTPTEQKEIVWLPKSLAEKIKSLEDGRDLENEVFKYIEDSKRNLRLDLEGLDDDVLQYRASMLRAKTALKAAFAEEMQEFEKIWDKHSEDFANVKKKAATLIESLAPVKNAIAEVNKEISTVNRWDIVGLIEMLNTIKNQLDTEGETGRIIKFLFNNYKRS